MGYSLLIVDDEQTARESLSSLVRWKDLGFEVCGALDDGKKAIEFLSRRQVDVILTDVRMTSASGIDVARFVHDKRLGTKVVLISGYQSFEDARRAVGYDVAYFLPKPTSLEEISRVFRELGARLEEERRGRELQKDAGALLLGSFFSDLILGALRSPQKIARRLALIDPALDASRSSLGTVRVGVLEGASASDVASFLLGDSREESPINPVALQGLEVYSWVHVISPRELLICLLDRRGRASRELAREIDAKMQLLREGMESSLGVAIRPEPAQAHRSAAAFAEALAAWTPGAGSGEVTAERRAELRALLRERRKLLVSAVEQADAELAMDVLDSILTGLEPLGMDAARDSVIDLIGALKGTLEEHGVPLQGLFAELAGEPGEAPFSYSSLSCCRGLDEIRAVSGELLGRLICRVSEHAAGTERNAVARAQEFIQHNYARPIGLESVADHVFLSPVYLSRLFKEKTGENFIGFLTRLRISRARELLRSPALRIYEIAASVGYPNVKYFTRVFRKATGDSPSEYREKLGLGRDDP